MGAVPKEYLPSGFAVYSLGCGVLVCGRRVLAFRVRVQGFAHARGCEGVWWSSCKVSETLNPKLEPSLTLNPEIAHAIVRILPDLEVAEP